MEDNPLSNLKPPCLYNNPIITQAHYIKNCINKAILENKKYTEILLKDQELYPTNKILLEDNGFAVRHGWIGGNVPIDGIIYDKVNQYEILWQ